MESSGTLSELPFRIDFLVIGKILTILKILESMKVTVARFKHLYEF